MDEGVSNVLDHADCTLANSELLTDLTPKVSHLEIDQATEITRLLLQHAPLFSDVPRLCNLLCHDVDVNGARHIRQAPYRLNTNKRQFLQAETQRLLDGGIIERSSSPWASPVVLVPKKGGTYRLCVDYRKINPVTQPDSYPLPRIEDIDDVEQVTFVSKVDLLSGYHQISLTERAKPISAIITPDGLFSYKRLPFSLRNAPATFQRLMGLVLQGLEVVHCYLADIVVTSGSWAEPLTRLEALFLRLDAANLIINLTKSEFGHAQLEFLGHVVGQGLVAPVQAKIDAVQKFPTSTDKKAVMRFLGFCGYYRHFCRNFSQVATSLTDLLSSKRKFECQKAFESLQELMTSIPVLHAPNL